MCISPTAGEDEDVYPIPRQYMYTSTVLWCLDFPDDERKEVHLDLSSLW